MIPAWGYITRSDAAAPLIVAVIVAEAIAVAIDGKVGDDEGGFYSGSGTMTLQCFYFQQKPRS